jgi:3,4-dihydroxy 2-butanone 4-phosphate synthase/GTP cyclohydrolase II
VMKLLVDCAARTVLEGFKTDPPPVLDQRVHQMSKISSIEEAIKDIAAGKMVILVDDEDRENEGDFVIAAECVTPEVINFMSLEGRGLICLAMVGAQVKRLGLNPMVRLNRAPLGTAFTQSIDLRKDGGVGAKGRSNTILSAIQTDANPDDFVVPGYVFPLEARPGGVLVRSGQTEGSVDLARLAGLNPSAVICEVMALDGTMSRLNTLAEFGKKHDIKVITVADLIAYRLQHEPLVVCRGSADMPTEFGQFKVHTYENTVNGQVHVALTVGEINSSKATLVRVHRGDTVADVFGVGGLKSRSRLAWCMKRMASEGRGVLLYLRTEGESERLDEKVRSYGALARGERLSQTGTTMGFHDFGVGAQILRALGLRDIRVMTNVPRVFKGLSGFGLQIVDWMPIEGEAEVG